MLLMTKIALVIFFMIFDNFSNRYQYSSVCVYTSRRRNASLLVSRVKIRLAEDIDLSILYSMDNKGNQVRYEYTGTTTCRNIDNAWMGTGSIHTDLVICSQLR
jgi:hypothetical protein